MDVRNIESVPAFMTKDGSEIRELLAPGSSAVERQSLAEARLAPGCCTTPHYHKATEEIYFILAGEAQMQVGKDRQTVRPGDAIAIPPGRVHQITNTGSQPLRFLCCCVPAYRHEDTVLVGSPSE